jgi:threonine synthase
MDIQLASNFERYLYFLLDRDPAAVRALLDEMAQTGTLQVDGQRLEQVQADFDARAVSDDETLHQIRQTFDASGYILCPHTAVGARAAAERPEAVVLATAHPAKFNEAVLAAIGREAPAPPSLQGLMARETRCAELPATAEAVRGFIEDTLAGAEAAR